jgi:plastocyanin
MRSFIHVAHRVGVLVVAAALACGGSTDPGTAGDQTPGGGGTGGGGSGTVGTTVTVTNNTFTPDNVTIPVGGTVLFKWDACVGDGYGSTTCTSHTVTFNDGTTSDMLSSGTYSRSFSAAGTYSYKCSVHGTYMTGTVVVR